MVLCGASVQDSDRRLKISSAVESWEKAALAGGQRV